MKQPIWAPSESKISNANMTSFMQHIAEKYNAYIQNYQDLHSWSIKNLECFWKEIWQYNDIKASKSFSSVMKMGSHMRDTKWFVDAELNFAQNLLHYRDRQNAIIFVNENQDTKTITYAELYDNVARLVKSLKRLDIKPGDRIVGFMPNIIETIVAMLAATSLGATWSSCSPDFGIKGVLDRFGQIEPKVLFAANGYYYNGKQNDSLGRIREIVKELPSIEKLVVVKYTENEIDLNDLPNAVLYDEFLSAEDNLSIDFLQLPFDHPLYIMYSSGTTGLPKCMVQSAGGILLNQLKEHILHVDLKRKDVIFYYTTCGWMMWNWLMSSLAVGATLVLFDGSPFYPQDDFLWKMAEEHNISVFGTSAKYLTALEQKQVFPNKKYQLSQLRCVLSTGSPLPEESFYYVYEHIKKDLHLASISGGTDLNGCFVAGNPISPVYPGEIQCKCLGMDIYAYNDCGQSVEEQKGELVCCRPFPSMPIYFWNDPDGERYRKAYFDVYGNTWCHGDYIEITANNGIIIHGRSDATLNPGGVRIGTAEIYRQIDGLEEIEDSVVVGQKWKDDTRVILFVKMTSTHTLTEELKQKIKSQIRTHASIRHVPAKIIAIDDIPYTISMKKVEIAIRDIIHGCPVVNQDALKNPECLEQYKNIVELQQD